MISASVQIQAQFYHLDPMEVVWHGNYVRFFEQARCALLDKIDYNYPQMRDSGYVWPIVDMRVKFVRPVTFGQNINVEATIAEYENRLKINYLITDVETGEKITKGFTIQVAVDAETQEMEFESPVILFDKIKEATCAS
ncbi:acyl-CoA thioesterase [Terasakiella sp. A23]|uniref:acyl-CoA thioesterase n=1 Tax=Terasakiella sp. FCG-A23 TaxID=3080561 RepID=UPI002954217B|nr:acyl-CoA thioesterase [Terasakiella sp. A23]MDV7341028.1 acyl-CoA thioesterase [Terasakiella sp. A23]